MDRIRLFDNPLLERLTLARPLPVALAWAAVIAALAAWAVALPGFRPGAGLGWAVAGVGAWGLFEYGMHRVAFHWPVTSAAGRRLVFLMHGCHHAQPEDPLRGIMPLLASAPIALALFGAAALVLPLPWLPAFFAGFLAGYLHYDLTHWACHHARPRTRWGRFLRRHHLRHHYAGRGGNFGVSTPVWDWAFGTRLTDRPRRS